MTKRTDFGGYGDMAGDWDDYAPYHSPWVIRWLEERLAAPGVRIPSVLDVGCGTGNFTRSLYIAGLKIVRGVDPDPRMIARAKGHKREFPFIDYSVAPTSMLPFASETFHAVTAHWSFDNFCHDLLSVMEIMRVLKPGGLFMTVTWPLGPLGQKRNAVLRKFFRHPQKPLTGYEAGDRSYAPLLQEWGFEDVETRSKEVHISYSLEAAYQYMRRSSLLARIPKREQRRAYRTLRQLCARERDENGRVPNTINVIVDIGKKSRNMHVIVLPVVALE